jgi:hypothetical protein
VYTGERDAIGVNLTRNYAKILSNSHFSVTRQSLQRGEPPQRAGFSVSRQLLLLSETLLLACFPEGVQVGEPAQRTGFSVVRFLLPVRKSY